jgi:putative addiction module component (TIGR02574 family)
MVDINLAELLKLPPAQRAEIAVALWDSLIDDPEAEAQALLPLDPELAAELDRRLTAHEREPGTAIPWAEVRRRLFERP